MISELSNHLWQSTAFVAVAALVAFALRNNGAHVRHVVWLIASVKFLVPFSLLLSLGSMLPAWTLSGPTMAETSGVVTAAREMSVAVERVVQPFAADTVEAVLSSTTPQSSMPVGAVLCGLWAIGFLTVVAMRVRGWRRVRAAVRASAPLSLPGPYPVRSAPGLLEPGVVGLWRPVLLLPAGIEQHLSPAQLRAVLEHEVTHIRRRDNLTSALHMVVEAVCWFHPVVWWVGARLVDERERACDEQVLRVCGEPQVYAESILNVCKLYVESPLVCVSGVSGSDLKKRVTAIMAGRVGVQLTVMRQVALAAVAVIAISTPLLAGMAGGAYPAQQTSTRFDAVTVKPCETDASAPQPAPRQGLRTGGSPWTALVSPGHVYWHCGTLAQLIPQAYADSERPLQNVSMSLKREDDFQPTYVSGGPTWLTRDRFTIEAKVSPDVTSVVLGANPSRMMGTLPPTLSMALRAVLEDRFQLKVERATGQRDLYVMTVAPGGLKRDKITSPSVGDCQTIEQYAAAAAVATAQTVAERVAAGNPRICGRYFSGRDDEGYYYEFTGVSLGFLANQLSSTVDYVVVDRTETTGLFNFKIRQGTLGMDGKDSFYARELADLGLKLALEKGPFEHLVVERVERLRVASADTPATTHYATETGRPR
jgi:bla regulator protein BlaR1